MNNKNEEMPHIKMINYDTKEYENLSKGEQIT